MEPRLAVRSPEIVILRARPPSVSGSWLESGWTTDWGGDTLDLQEDFSDLEYLENPNFTGNIAVAVVGNLG